ncbi:MAG TPA: Rne/Rng family ribonuclease [Thermoanaerobaculia bacterium]|jgi:ribonuclease G|nr:Rne/Rng family ribonuclease [Thermoanaerobaculia bacterium]
MSREIVINAAKHESRIAVLDEGQVVELWVERTRHRTIVGNIYKGRVTKVLPGMQSAFVDLGLERDAFLYVSDVIEDLEEFDNADSTDDLTLDDVPQQRAEASISDLLREGQEIVVQVSKDTIAGKGARITSHITLPGRFLVYMPTVNHIGVSRRIENEAERARLKEILDRIRPAGAGGFIVRTAGEEREEDEFRADLKYLTDLWEQIRRKAEKASAPTAMHHDLDLVLRTIRDVLSPEFKSVWVDSVDQYQRIVEFLDQIQPNLVSRVRLYRREEPIFEDFSIEAEIAKALKSKVWLKSGGYIVINQTEALVAIDVNTGKYVGKRNLEETVFKTNLEAAKEIVRQIRLRDLGGIIVLDFIDMEDLSNRARLFEALEAEIRKDRSKTKILQISEFGLIEMTRKRVRQSLERSLTQACPYCGGSGRIKSNTTIAFEIWRELMKLRDLHEGQDVIVRLNPVVYTSLNNANDPIFEEIERNLGIHLVFKPDDSLHHEQFDVMRI